MKLNKLLKGSLSMVLIGALVTGMLLPTAIGKNTAIVEATEGAKIIDTAISTVSFSNTVTGIENMNATSTDSKLVTDDEHGSVLQLGKSKRSYDRTKGVELVNPFVGKTDLVESLVDGLRNNGVIYNGTTADETWLENGIPALDPLAMPLEGRTYPFPKYTKGVSVSMWVKAPADYSNSLDEEDWNNVPILFSFNRESMDKGLGTLLINMNGDVLFIGGTENYDETGQPCEVKNAVDFVYDKNAEVKKDVVSNKGQWVYVTMVIENDWISVYYNGEATEASIRSLKVGKNFTKCFNRGFGYRGALEENPSEIYKLWPRMLQGFTEEERANNDFSNFEHYFYQQSTCDSIMEYLIDDETSLYLGGAYAQSWYSNTTYRDAMNGVKIDDVSFFDRILTEEEVAQLYSEVKPAQPTETPAPTETPEPTEAPTEVVVSTETPKPTETPEVTETPKPTETPAPTETPTEVVVPTETPAPTKVPTEAPVVTETPVPTETLVPVEYWYGDVDKNGNVTAEDALSILKHVVKLELIEEEIAILLADVNQNEAIEAADALEALKVVVKLKEAKKYIG